MSHVDSSVFAALAEARRVRARDLGHVDRCLSCRHAAAAAGISAATLATALAATGSRARSIGAAALIAGAIAATAVALPLRGAAAAFISVFEPHAVSALPLTADDLRSLSRMPDLAAYGSAHELRAMRSATYTDLRSAAVAAGFPLRAPAFAPTAVRAASFTVNGASTQLFTFGQRATASQTGAPAIALPSDIAGSTLRIDIGATVIAMYDSVADAAEQRRLSRRIAANRPPVQNRSTTSLRSFEMQRTVSASRSNAAPSTHVPAMLPLVVVQMPVPRIAASGVSIRRLATFMLSRPGISPRIAAAFTALGDPAATLPIPVPIDRAYTQPVVVDGVQGVGMGDDTGLGAAVVWQKNAMLYGVFAAQPARDVLAIANSLR